MPTSRAPSRSILQKYGFVVFTFGTLCLGAFLHAACKDGKSHASNAKNEKAEETLAKVDDVVITVGEFSERINKQSPYVRARYTSLERKKEFLDNLVRFEGGAKGIIHASQISNGDENDLNIRVYGTKASLEWHQEDPNELIVKYANAPRKIYRRGNDYISEAAAGHGYTRTPFAHPEGFIEAFANIYLAAARAIADRIDGNPTPEGGYDFPTVDDGVAGVAFIKATVESSAASLKWMKFPAM